MATTKTTWSETINNLGFNVVAGIRAECFFCPVFGTTHRLPEPSNKISGQRNLRIFNYRGYIYYIKEVYNTERADYYYAFGLYVSPKQEGDLPALHPVMFVSKDMSHSIHFDTMGKVMRQQGMVSSGYAIGL